MSVQNQGGMISNSQHDAIIHGKHEVQRKQNQLDSHLPPPPTPLPPTPLKKCVYIIIHWRQTPSEILYKHLGGFDIVCAYCGVRMSWCSRLWDSHEELGLLKALEPFWAQYCLTPMLFLGGIVFHTAVSPDVILCGWLDSKHLLTNWLIFHTAVNLATGWQYPLTVCKTTVQILMAISTKWGP